MFFQLSEIRKQQALTDNLEQSKQKTHDVLIGSYNFKQRTDKPLRDRFGSILNQSALLLHILQQIQESIKHKCLLPSIFNDRELNKLIYNRGSLPQWFQHVFQKEYQKEKINIEIVAIKFYKLHALSQKHYQLQKQYQNLQNIFARYESINEKQLHKINIIDEMDSFQSLYQTCKEIYKNFLSLMTRKVLQFLQKTIQSTLTYSNQLKKVKSTQNFQNPLTFHTISSPRFYVQKKNSIDTTTLKGNKVKNIHKIYDYYPQNANQTKGKLQNYSTVESLRQRQKQNNEFFFRKALSKEKFNQTFQTQQIKTYRSQNSNKFSYPLTVLKLNELQTSRDSSRRKERNFYQESLALKGYESIRSAKSIDETQLNSKHYKSPSKNYQTKAEEKSGFKRNEHQCLHHCPHHDKILNNHCSKHCEKLCSHEKQYFQDFGLDLTKMDREFYKSRQKVDQQQIKTFRSVDLSRQSRDFLSPQIRKRDNLSPSYLRNSHDKHSSISPNKKVSFMTSKNSQNMMRQNIDYSGRSNIYNQIKNLKSPYKRQQSPQSVIKYQTMQSGIKYQPILRSQYYC